MVSGPDQVQSFFNDSLLAIRDALSPLESGFRCAAKDLESRWLDSRDSANNHEFFSKFSRSSSKKLSHDPVAVAVDDRRPSLNSSGGNGGARKGRPLKRSVSEEDRGALCSNCLDFAAIRSLLADNLAQVPNPLKSVEKRVKRQCGRDGIAAPGSSPPKLERRESHHEDEPKISALEGEQVLQPEFFLCYVFDNLARSLQVFDQSCRKSCNQLPGSNPAPVQFDCLKIVAEIVKGKKADVDGFLSNMGFARVRGASASLVGLASAVKDGHDDRASCGGREGPTPQKIANVLLSLPLSNVERLRSTLSTFSLTELIGLVPQLGRSSEEHPNKKKLFSVQDFFRYTKAEGRRFFEELDRDGDGHVTLEDLEIAMRKRRLPKRYAQEFLRRTRRHLFSKSIGWKQFLSLMEQKEPTILRAYTTLCLSKSGTLEKNQILTSLKSAGLPANTDNAAAMMRYLDADNGGSISYNHFRNFMLLLPSERLEDDPRNIWFEAATVVAVSPPVEIAAESVLKSALAGGLACALSTSVMHPVDTMKTRVQASTLSFPELVSKLPQIGIQGLYRGSVPAILGQFSSHGLRTGIFEASKLILINVAPKLPAIQVQSMASFCSTILGTAVRIPCEVLKQRLQAGIFDNVEEAIVGTLRVDGIKGFFRGTGATLCREVPFYVAGMALYEEAKKGAHKLLGRDLKPWETIAVGALSGGLAAVVTTPFDVIKTRMMTAPQGVPVSMQIVAFTILRQEGPLGLFKGAVPRFFWTAPLGAMNFAGYELARKAMDRTEHVASERLPQKRMASVV